MAVEVGVFNILRGIPQERVLDPVEQQTRYLQGKQAQAELDLAPLHRQVAEQQIEGAKLDLEQRRQEAARTKALNAAYQDSLTVGPDGQASIDTGRLTQALGTAGHGSVIPTVLK